MRNSSRGMHIVISPRRVTKNGRRYIIVVPKEIGEKLHGKLVKVILESIEVLDEGQGDG